MNNIPMWILIGWGAGILGGLYAIERSLETIATILRNQSSN